MNAPAEPPRVCRRCQKPLEGLGLRRDATTCSKQCRQALHRQSKVKPRPTWLGALEASQSILERLADGAAVGDGEIAHALEQVSAALTGKAPPSIDARDARRVELAAVDLEPEDDREDDRDENACRVAGCEYARVGTANHGFCAMHLEQIPAPFKAKWESAGHARDLERVWEQIADDFAFEAAPRP